MRIGYARVSRTDQQLELQTDALRAAGAEKIYKDRISGATAERPGLDSLMTVARSGDTIVVWRLDRLARSMQHLIELSADLNERGIELVSLTENIDTSSPSGKLFFHIFGAIGEFERNLIIERTRAGLDAARAKGKKGGRKPVLDEEKQKAVRSMLDADIAAEHEHDFKKIGHVVGVSERTIRRFAKGEYRK